VAEFAPAELAAVLGWSTETAKVLMGDALELRCRLPRVWEDVLAGRVAVPLARFIAQQTCDLDPETARRSDRMLAGGGKLTRAMVRRIVDEQRLYDDPDRAVADEQDALRARKVELRPGATPATTEVTMELDTADADAFDQTVRALAESLARLVGGEDGEDVEDVEVRRARAVGILADPQAALDLLAAGHPPRKPGGGAANLTLNLDLDLSTLADLAVHGITGPVHDERRGVATTELIREWLTSWLGPDATISVKPYLDLTHPETLRPVDGHDPTGPMIDFVRLRDPCCVFPGCRKRSRRCDLDHIDPYVSPDDGGPPGQTHPDNLAPLCRHHHRAKTHGRWGYRRLPDDGYRWTTPTGRTIDVPSPRRPRLR
jgi:hypothetical protein